MAPFRSNVRLASGTQQRAMGFIRCFLGAFLVESVLMRESLCVKEFAGMAGVSRNTVREWVKSGKLRAHQIAPRGWWRIPVAEAERLGLKVRE